MTTLVETPNLPVVFNPLGPLPTGAMVLEASAGTGKTHTLVGLAVRYVAETGIDIAQLLLVTFSRAATEELRMRARERFEAAAAALGDPVAARADPDEVVRHLADAPADDVLDRRNALLAALVDFDTAAIVTTHSFCGRMLDELGPSADLDPRGIITEDLDELVSTVVDDVYLARYARAVPPFSLSEAQQLALAAVRDRHAQLAPVEAEGPAGERVAFVTAVRTEVGRRKKLSGLRDFDDVLVGLRDALADPETGPRAVGRIAARYRVVLVDEFQDTDPVQWEILSRAFGEAEALVLVGDPKQAIYGFRGAELRSYLAAVDQCPARQRLTTNRRSDAGLLTAFGHLWSGAALGHPTIVADPVAASMPWTRLSGPGDVQAPLRLRCVSRTGSGPLNQSGFPSVGRLRETIARDLADDIARVLRSGMRLADPEPRPVEPGDIAVLVRTRTQLDVVRGAVENAGVPVVPVGGTSVFATESARNWWWVLRALEAPGRPDRVRLAASTPLFGCTLTEVDSQGADLVDRVATQLRSAGRLFARQGFAAVFDELARRTRLAERLLEFTDGPRQLTDIRHIAGVLDRVAHREGLSVPALTQWLAERVRDPTSGVGAAERSRRLDRDTPAVQVVTVHASKGLEFPLVYVPFGWDSGKNPKALTQLLHQGPTRILDVGGPDAPGYAERKKLAESEEAGEELRLCYVAFTRARCQVVAWWAPGFPTATSPLHRLLWGRAEGADIAERVRVPADNIVVQQLSQWARQAPDGAIDVAPVPVDVSGDKNPTRGGHPETVRKPVPSEESALAVARFERTLDHEWRRTSYSALTAEAHGAATVDPAAAELSDEPVEPEEESSAVSEQAGPPARTESTESERTAASPTTSAMSDLPAGAEFGTVVHEILEYVRTDSKDLAAEVRRLCEEAVRDTVFGTRIDSGVLAAALLGVLRTPLGFGSLAGIAPRDRLSELGFELPLAGGTAAVPDHPHATIRSIAELLREYLPRGEEFGEYPDQLATLTEVRLRGYLTGSIDAVLRTPDGRYVIVDYKTNRIAPRGPTGEQAPLTLAHYTRDCMRAEMIRSHYPLQALLYTVALHRYLRWRIRDYRPERHLGGIRYLFVRGMIGPETPPGTGVFDWEPPSAMITALSRLLAGEAQ